MVVGSASAETVTSGTENEGNMLTCVVLVLYRMGADREIQYDRILFEWIVKEERNRKECAPLFEGALAPVRLL